MLIGITGLKGSGKNTVASLIKKKYPEYEITSFAKILKDAVAILFDWDRDMLEGNNPESRAWREQPDVFWSECTNRLITPRHILQKVGTDLFRNGFHKDFWVNRLLKMSSKNKNLIVTDPRFSNELEIFDRVIQVERGPRPFWWREAEYYNQAKQNSRDLHFDLNLKDIKALLDRETHESEYSWIGVRPDTLIVTNDGTLDQLSETINEKIFL